MKLLNSSRCAALVFSVVYKSSKCKCFLLYSASISLSNPLHIASLSVCPLVFFFFFCQRDTEFCEDF